jgi:HPr kinase/phosphorylase
MKSNLTIGEFHQRFQKRLQLSFASGQVGLDREIQLSTSSDNSFEAVDYLNIVRPSSVIVIGHKESSYLFQLDLEELYELLDDLFSGPVSALIMSQGASLSEQAIDYCSKASIAVFRSEMQDADLLSNLRYFLNQSLAEKTTEHGVYIEVHSIGTFITGESGVGKSELALSLISRGHRLIADDMTEFSRISPGAIDGSHPGMTNDFMEVRGLGIVNIRAMFGANALRRNKNLRLIVNMVPFTLENSHQFDRLGSSQKTRKILGLEIPELTLPVAPGRNLAILVEAAARNQLLKMGGYNSAEDFIEQQRRAIQLNIKD